MSERAFLDTNVLVYAHDARDLLKREQAQQLILRLLRERRGVVSVQVLQEFFAAATRKLEMPGDVAKRHVASYARLDVVSLAVPDALAAIDLHRLHGFSIWDALIVRAALNGSCATLYTEDLQHGRLIDTLVVGNPFAVQNTPP